VNLEGDIRLMAEKTSLGADNGAGAAVMLALLEDQTIIHGPLDLLFTVEEVITYYYHKKIFYL
jgi:dipeptidase D